MASAIANKALFLAWVSARAITRDAARACSPTMRMYCLTSISRFMFAAFKP